MSIAQQNVNKIEVQKKKKLIKILLILTLIQTLNSKLNKNIVTRIISVN